MSDISPLTVSVNAEKNSFGLLSMYSIPDSSKVTLKNQDMWMQGAYYYEALLDAAPVLRFSFSKKPPKPVPYREQPFELHTGQRKAADSGEKQLTQQEKSDKRAKAMMEMFMVSINKKFEKKGGEGNG